MVKELTGLTPGQAVPETAKAKGAAAAEKGFGEFLNESLQKVNDLQKDAVEATTQLAEGEGLGIQEAMVAIEKADVAFKLMMEVRQKILDAYQDVMRMQV